MIQINGSWLAAESLLCFRQVEARRVDQSHPGMEWHNRAPAPSPTVSIISDVLLFREGLSASLTRDGRLEVLDLLTSASALSAISRRTPDAVLLDGAMSECLELSRRIRKALPGIRIIGFGISGGAPRLVDCAESGLAAFTDSDGTVEDLVGAVFGALRGELECSPQVSALLCERLAGLSAGATRPAILTRREGEIARLIGEGLSNKEIANDLNIGPSTVKNHVHSILEKLNVRRRSAIVSHLGECT
jgi:two-component system, NarL family, nitrate/nitrite response regulator NarL